MARRATEKRRPVKRNSRPPAGKGERKRVAALTQQIASGAAAVATAEDQLTETVRRSVVRTLRQPQTTALQFAQVARTLAREAMAAAPDLFATGRAVAKGVVLGFSDVGGDVIAPANAIARAAVQAAADAGSEVRAVTLRALQGIVEAAQAAGGDASKTARQAISSVSDTVLAAGQTATSLAEQLVEGAQARLAATAPAKRPPVRRRPARQGAKRAVRRQLSAGSGQRRPASRSKRR